MGEAPQQQSSQMSMMRLEDEKIGENQETTTLPWYKQYKWWLQMAIYSFFVLAGQTVGNLLGRVYFNNGGNSKWMATLVQVVGFPTLLPFQWFTTNKKPETDQPRIRRYNVILPSIYVGLGLFVAQNCMLYTIGIQYLPVTTYTLICATQLVFNAFFSYFLNKQKITPYIINSVVLLTISSTLLVFETDPGDSNKTTKTKYMIGFMSTLGASAGYALLLSVTQVAFKKVIKRENIRSVVDMSIYQSVVATLVILIGLFASGEWRKLNKEMDGFKTGAVSYVMNLFWTAVAWQAFSVGAIGLIFKVSSLFSNVISILGLPLGPVFAVIFLHDTLTGLKAISMVLAIWGFVSYTYQHYLDDRKMKRKKSDEDRVSDISLAERGL